MHAKLDEVLEQIRPAVRAHGGEIEIASVDEVAGIVKLSFRGACGHCALAPVTLKLGVEPLLKKTFPWITSVIAE
jgi:Fe-S cluster biogenesis protein NfuA